MVGPTGPTSIHTNIKIPYETLEVVFESESNIHNKPQYQPTWYQLNLWFYQLVMGMIKHT